jgi:hypothetical protein
LESRRKYGFFVPTDLTGSFPIIIQEKYVRNKI